MDNNQDGGKNKNQKKDKELPSTSHRILTSLTAGAFAGALAKTTIAPLDRTKIYFQTTPSAPFSTRTVLKYLLQTYRTTGFLSLYRGNSATMARIVPYSAIQFSAHEQYKHLLTPLATSSPQSTRFLAGSLAGITAQSLTYPLDMTRARLAVSPRHKYRNLGDVFVKVVRQEGPSTLFRGYFPTMLGVIPYAGFSFYTYETLKKSFAEKYDAEPSPVVRLLFGAVSGVIGQTSSYPLDIVRRRMQVGVVMRGGGGGGGKWWRVWGLLVEIGRTEGVIRGLYKGLSMNWIKGPVAAGISFSVFDWASGVLRRGVWS